MAGEENTERNRTEVLLEDLRDQFTAFGEGLEVVSRQAEELRAGVRGIDRRVERVEDFLKAEIPLIRSELTEIRKELGMKADLARLEALEARVDRLERAAAQAS